MEKTASTKNTTYTLVAIALMTAVICVLAPLSLPIGPVPISMATLVLFLSIYVLGWKKATISVCLYILLGLVGVPVFSGFTGGVSKLAGATLYPDGGAGGFPDEQERQVVAAPAGNGRG